MITIHQRHRRTDRQTTCDRNTALCTKVHRAVITYNVVIYFDKKKLYFLKIIIRDLLLSPISQYRVYRELISPIISLLQPAWREQRRKRSVGHVDHGREWVDWKWRSIIITGQYRTWNCRTKNTVFTTESEWSVQVFVVGIFLDTNTPMHCV